ncbi:MAG: AarF/UbiB family protein [Thermoanaerobaculia bacterium]
MLSSPTASGRSSKSAKARAIPGRLGILARLAAHGLRRRHGSTESERERAWQAIAGLFRDARGITMKVGQVLLGDRPGAEVVRSEPLPLAAIRPALEAELGSRLSHSFRRFDESRAAASLGQVHAAELLDGSRVAVKVRYPGIERAVRRELRLAGLLPGVGPLRRFGFDLDRYRRLLAEDLARELDYRSEAERQLRFYHQLAVPGLVVPRPFPSLSRPGLLVQSWEDGEPLSSARGWPRLERAELARILVRTLLASLFQLGEVHGDPNPGNYLFRRGENARPEVVLLDYGCTLELESPRRLALLQLLLALREGGSIDLLACLGAIGFDLAKLAPLADRLPEICQALFEPFLLDRPFDPSRWRLAERLGELLGELRWWFRAAGPADSVFLLRAFQGLAQQLEALDVPLAWWPMLTAVVPEETLAEARRLELPTPAGITEPPRLECLARFLRVVIQDQGEELLALCLPAVEVAHLEELVPPAVAESLAGRGVRLGELVRRVLAGGVRPQELIALEDGTRTYQVWLE